MRIKIIVFLAYLLGVDLDVIGSRYFRHKTGFADGTGHIEIKSNGVCVLHMKEGYFKISEDTYDLKYCLSRVRANEWVELFFYRKEKVMDGKIPIIRIEVDGIRERIGQALALHNDDFDTMIQIAVQKVFTVETIQAKIEMQVAKALDESIDGLSESFQVQEIIKDIVVQSLVKVCDEIEKRKA